MKAQDCSETPLTTSFHLLKSGLRQVVQSRALDRLAIRLMAKWNEAALQICQPFRLAQGGPLAAYSGAEAAVSRGEFQDARENMPVRKDWPVAMGRRGDG